MSTVSKLREREGEGGGGDGPAAPDISHKYIPVSYSNLTRAPSIIGGFDLQR